MASAQAIQQALGFGCLAGAHQNAGHGARQRQAGRGAIGQRNAHQAFGFARAVGDIGDERLLLITALALLDELDSARRGVSAQPGTEARAVEVLLTMASRVEALAARLENET